MHKKVIAIIAVILLTLLTSFIGYSLGKMLKARQSEHKNSSSNLIKPLVLNRSEIYLLSRFSRT